MKFLSSLKGKPPIEELPLLPLRELVLFPNITLSVFVTYKEGMRAIDEALKRDKRLFAACLKFKSVDETYEAGSVVRITQHLKMPDNTFRVVLHGEYRGLIASSAKAEEVSMVRIDPIKPVSNTPLNSEAIALMRAVQSALAQYADCTKKVSTELLVLIEKTESLETLANLSAHALQIKPEQKIEILTSDDPVARLQLILEILELENEVFSVQQNIRGKVKNRIEKSNREYILNEQLKEINRELGKDERTEDFTELEQKIEAKKPRGEALFKARKELVRLQKLHPFTPEAGILRVYLEWILDLPWNEFTADSGDLAEAERILNEDHFNMRKAKERILEFIAVRKLLSLENEQAGIKGSILCFVGSPGTGKTSLGKSVARALGRRFVRFSLGGVRDEAEIRGHRKTYVGALPGKIIQYMSRAGTINPVFLLDEIDKIAVNDVRGDPAAALLEVLDPEQNSNFMDHYMEVPYDLSQVLFIATANSLHTIPYPLLDRMEIIEIPGYGDNEKLAIAQHFLIPKELSENGLGQADITFKDEAVQDIIQYWTMESGVRSLEREIARCIRRIAQEAVNQEYGKDPEKPIGSFQKLVDREDVEKLMGRRKYKEDVVFKEAQIGISYGLAWTSTGGTVLPIETVRFDGSGEVTLTGNLGDVMKESAQIGVSYLRSIQEQYNFLVQDVGKTDFHIHIPEGAIPKDGPSAGVALAASLLSSLCQKPPKPGIAITGELTLTGRILPIGGLKEKVLAAIRNGMKQVLIPLDNKDDWAELEVDITSAIEVAFVENAVDAFSLLFDVDSQKSPEQQGRRFRRHKKPENSGETSNESGRKM
ncbi:MAG: endopeptidase La [Treponema sp.]|jgi:ATP-dependent Lon protease|nr:endopeptidase La [Treponema sp.]